MAGQGLELMYATFAVVAGVVSITLPFAILTIQRPFASALALVLMTTTLLLTSCSGLLIPRRYRV